MVRIGTRGKSELDARGQNETEEEYLTRMQMEAAAVEEQTKKLIEESRVKLREKQLVEELHVRASRRLIAVAEACAES